MTERQQLDRSRRGRLGALAAVIAAGALALPAAAVADEPSKAIVVQTAVLYTEPGLDGAKLGEIAPGTVVAFLDKHCTERRIQTQTADGWVLDLAVVPITGPDAAPQRIFAMAQHLENRARGSAVEAQQHRDEILMLYAVLLDYFPSTAYAAQAVERLETFQWYTAALVTPAG
jgi:hypothetical protein